MSWIESLKKDFVLQTGDEIKYYPEWLNASHQTSYNVSEFIFPNVAGTLVTRDLPLGTKYNLEIYFQGENHLTEASNFELSARDNRPWNVSHPFYGSLLVHPSSLTFDQTKLNVTKITGSITETIDIDGVASDVSPVDDIELTSIEVNENAAEVMELVPLTNSEIANATIDNDNAFTEFSKAVTTQSQTNALTNAYNEANAAIATATIAPIIAMRKAQSVLTLPAKFEDTVTARFDTLRNTFTALMDSALAFTKIGEKRYLEGQSSALVTAMCNTAATPKEGDYPTRTSVENMITNLVTQQGLLISTFDSLSNQDYSPNRETFQGINRVVNFTISELFNIALGAKQERTVTTNEDSNIILLAHRFYGLKTDDSTIKELAEINNLGLNNVLEIKSGTNITYLV